MTYTAKPTGTDSGATAGMGGTGGETARMDGPTMTAQPTSTPSGETYGGNFEDVRGSETYGGNADSSYDSGDTYDSGETYGSGKAYDSASSYGSDNASSQPSDGLHLGGDGGQERQYGSSETTVTSLFDENEAWDVRTAELAAA